MVIRSLRITAVQIMPAVTRPVRTLVSAQLARREPAGQELLG
jgi:hypothetical protein